MADDEVTVTLVERLWLAFVCLLLSGAIGFCIAEALAAGCARGCR
jgi:hypothetical protein